MGRRKLLQPRKVFAAVERWFLEHGQAPTIEELRQALGVGSTRTVLRYLRELEEAGAIRRWKGARGIQLLRQSSGGAETIPVPLLGEAPAGPLMFAEENIESWLRLPTDMARPSNAKFFLLRVRGDSMNRAKIGAESIENRDLVLVRQQPDADQGDIVVALVDGEVTIKRLEKKAGYIALMPQSTRSEYRPIILTDDFRMALLQFGWVPLQVFEGLGKVRRLVWRGVAVGMEPAAGVEVGVT